MDPVWEKQHQKLEEWAELFIHFSSIQARLTLLEQELADTPLLIERHDEWWRKASAKERLIALELMLLEQPGINPLFATSGRLKSWIHQLEAVEDFYSAQGGLIGYQVELLRCLCQQPGSEIPTFVQPEVFDLQKDMQKLWPVIRMGFEALPLCAEIYPAGGAGDRLGFQDHETGQFLPVALLPFDGGTLFEAMVNDLFAREWLYFRIFGQQVCCPVAIMTSSEKGNHGHLLRFCESKDWFGRGRASFRLFSQPMVPVISAEGFWIVLPSGELMVKPGGHGVIWKLMQDHGVNQWLFDHHAFLLLIRQVNNPLAASDRNLLALVGIGLEENKIMGFASCPRVVGAAEGMNVVRINRTPSGPSMTLTNVEYTDFKKFGWKDEPAQFGSPYSAYPSNTNILFLNLQKAAHELSVFPIPGLVLNLKPTLVPGADEKIMLGRLESTMQNLADFFTTPLPSESNPPNPSALLALQSFCTHNDRIHTLSVTKKAWSPEESTFETPQGAYLDLLQQRLSVLQQAGWDVPTQSDASSHPCCLVFWHPALGPLHTIVAQRLVKGSLAKGAELRLDVAEVFCESLSVVGSLIVEAQQPLGTIRNHQIEFGPSCGQLVLKNVHIVNEGADPLSSGWDFTAQPSRRQSCHIILRGASRFTAVDVVFSGNVEIEVADGEWIEAIPESSERGYRLIRHPWSGSVWSTHLSWDGMEPVVTALTEDVSKLQKRTPA